MSTTIELEQDAVNRFDALPGLAVPGARHKPTSHDQPVLSIRAAVRKGDAGRFIAESLRDIRAFMHEHEIVPAGPPFSICRPHGNGLDVEAGWPTTTTPVTGTSRIHTGSLPHSLVGH